MATKSTGNGARTAQAWKAAATSAQASIKKADAAAYIAQGDLETATTFRDSYYKIANEKNADGTYKYTAAERAQATKDLATAEQEVVQAKAAVSNAAAQRTNAENAYNEATGKSAKNTDPQAASTSLPATTTPGQAATAYTTTPPDANVKIISSTSYPPPMNPDGSLMTPQQIADAKAALIAGNNNEGSGTTKKFITDEDGQPDYANVKIISSTSYPPPVNPDGSLMTPQQIADAKAALRAGNNNNNEGTGTTKKYITDEDGQTTLVAVDGVPVEAAQDKKTVTEFDEAAIAAARQAEYDAIEAKLYADAAASDTNRGLTSALRNTQTQATQQDYSNFNNREDWRVRLSLAPNSNYLYKDPDTTIAGILSPLKATNGVIFPYTPAISVAYAAQYDPASLTHTNYKYYTYNSSSVDQITLSCDFTAQDVFEATYLLAVIHFFKSVTKMFYGQDQDPKPGTPPPLCYLSGLGAFQFNNHPLAITNFTYSLPTDVDYIRAGTVQEQPKANQTFNSRLQDAKLQPGAQPAPPQFSGAYLVQEPTYVPTKIQISITAVPIVTRNDISNHFSLKDYAAGVLSKRPSGGGIW